MFSVPKKVADRIAGNLRKYQKIAETQQKADVAEADTVSLVKDILANVMGYDKWTELTSEFQIKSTYCDIAIMIAGKPQVLVEVKSTGTKLSDGHLTQAVNYAAHQGIRWVVLTNAIEWRLVRVSLSSQVNHETISTFIFTGLSARKADDLNYLYLVSREGLEKDSMNSYFDHVSTLNAYSISTIIRSEVIVSAIRREFRRYYPYVTVHADSLLTMLENQVLKRETVDSDKAKEAATNIKKAMKKHARMKAKAEIPTAS